MITHLDKFEAATGDPFFATHTLRPPFALRLPASLPRRLQKCRIGCDATGLWTNFGVSFFGVGPLCLVVLKEAKRKTTFVFPQIAESYRDSNF